MDFNEYWQKIHPAPRYENRKESARQEWNNHPEKHEAIMRWLQQHGAYTERNPYFFIQDFTVRKSESGEPTNYNGKALKKGVEYATAFYNGKWGMYTKDDIQKFNLQTKK